MCNFWFGNVLFQVVFAHVGCELFCGHVLFQLVCAHVGWQFWCGCVSCRVWLCCLQVRYNYVCMATKYFYIRRGGGGTRNDKQAAGANDDRIRSFGQKKKGALRPIL